jgi:polysaccharide pyruvyl transferase WcaK-like protein
MNKIPMHVAHKVNIPSRFLIIGWYGTETIGDKAILSEIIFKINKKNPNSQIFLASLFPYLSRYSLLELGYSNIEVIPTYSTKFWKLTRIANEVIMGGGPLMHLEQLGIVLTAFYRAKKAKHRTSIIGCGIGPLDRGQKYQEAVRQILYLSDFIELRDSASVDWANRITGREDIIKIEDPATGFVKRWLDQNLVSNSNPLLNLYLRELTTEYQGSMTFEEFNELKEHFKQQLGLFVHKLCERLDVRPRLLAMHHFYVGNDDREFNRRFSRDFLSDINPIIERAPFSVQEILASMQEATLSLCMRFHSVLFANVLDIPYIAIDYTNGGKIASYLSDHNRYDRMFSLKNIANGEWQTYLTKYDGN